jgi:hypothetical protein
MEKLVEKEKSVKKHFRRKDLKTTSTLVSFSINFFISIYISHRPSIEVTVLKNKTSITYIIQDSEYYKPRSIQRGAGRPEGLFLSPIVGKTPVKGSVSIFSLLLSFP